MSQQNRLFARMIQAWLSIGRRLKALFRYMDDPKRGGSKRFQWVVQHVITPVFFVAVAVVFWNLPPERIGRLSGTKREISVEEGERNRQRGFVLLSGCIVYWAFSVCRDARRNRRGRDDGNLSWEMPDIKVTGDRDLDKVARNQTFDEGNHRGGDK